MKVPMDLKFEHKSNRHALCGDRRGSILRISIDPIIWIALRKCGSTKQWTLLVSSCLSVCAVASFRHVFPSNSLWLRHTHNLRHDSVNQYITARSHEPKKNPKTIYQKLTMPEQKPWLVSFEIIPTPALSQLATVCQSLSGGETYCNPLRFDYIQYFALFKSHF